MSRLERLNDWCGDFLNKLMRYDDLITFGSFALLLLALFAAIIISALGISGVWK